MLHRFAALFLFTFSFLFSRSQSDTTAAHRWADSVFNSLSDDQRIAQLMVIRTSTIKDGQAFFFDEQVDSLISKYNVGAVCLFQGTPVQQAALINRIQRMAKTPVMVCVDGEWGLGMRFGGVQNFPFQLTMGAMTDAETVYQVGRAIGRQCRRIGIHVNYAPVVDINNNPANPVIGIRSFGEDKYKVGLMGSRIMEGMQQEGVMACAKHFPGHGDVSVDSHFDLPVINKTMAQLDSLELYPFREIFKKGIGSVMVAHLSIPAIDDEKNKPTSISYKNITGLMRNELGYQGLTFTDALEMQGVKKYYPDGEASVQSVIAGNDMLCLPGSVPQSILKIKGAIADGRLTWESVFDKCKRVLLAKYQYVVGKTAPVDSSRITTDLNGEIPLLRREVAVNALTVLTLEDSMLPFLSKKITVQKPAGKKAKQVVAKSSTAYIAFNSPSENVLASKLKTLGNVDAFNIQKGDSGNSLNPPQFSSYKRVIISLHGIDRYPKNNFGIPQSMIDRIHAIEAANPKTLVMLFGNCYMAKAFCNSKNLAVVYEDDSVFQATAADWLMGKFTARGTLPVTVCDAFKYGSGIVKRSEFLPAGPQKMNINAAYMGWQIDSLMDNAITQKATPGGVVTVVKDGRMLYQKAYGYQTYDSTLPITKNTIYDLASVTKISATNVAVMKLWEQGKLDLKKKISSYLPWLLNTNKENLTVENLLLHQAGMVSFIPFYKEVTGKDGHPNADKFSETPVTNFTVPVADSLYMRTDWVDTMNSRIATSAVVNNEVKYVYSDNDFILMGDIVAAITGQPLERYVKDSFYTPLGMRTTGFKPFEHFANSEVAPTEKEKAFRMQELHGYVHDPGAAMFGNVAGHAGLFSNGWDLAILYQMLLNGGTFDGQRYLKKETIDWFTAYQTPISRRGMGFDKPEKNNDTKTPEAAYPCPSASPLTFGHTGYTGICVWADPKYNLLFIFLSNRVNPDGGDNLKLSKLNVRSNIQEAIYRAIKAPTYPPPTGERNGED